MATELPALFGLLWPQPATAPAEPSPGAWAAIAAQAREHRLRPLLHSHAKGWPFAVPAPLAEDWASAHRRSAERALRQRAELVKIGADLAAAGIQATVLKGGAIAWRGWFDPALRPMRDLDLLVPTDAADAAQQLLRNLGYSGAEGPNAENDKHLPGLRSPRTNTTIEIHLHLIEPSGSSGQNHDQAFRRLCEQRLLSLPGTAVLALSDTDTLLHLILHGALDHQFNNGPVLLFDVVMLLEHGRIDWAAFWEAAEGCGGVRAAQLVLAFVQSLVPDAQPEWRGREPGDLDPSIFQGVAQLMLVERERRSLVGLPGRIGRHSWPDRLSELAKGVRRLALRQRSKRSAAIERPHPLTRGTLRQVKHGLDIARWLRS
jgi:hypothetical protein